VIHRCALRVRTIGATDGTPRSSIDHGHMMTALEDRAADRTACWAREHTLERAAPEIGPYRLPDFHAHAVAPRVAPVAKNVT